MNTPPEDSAHRSDESRARLREPITETESAELAEAVTADIEAPAGALAESGSFGYLPWRVAQYALLFGSALVVTRTLGPVGRAQYALPLALAGGIWVLTHLTLEIAAGRLLARREARLEQVVPALSLSVIFLSVIGVSVAVVVGLTQRDTLLANATGAMVVLAALTIPFLLLSQMAGQMLIVLGKLRAQGIAAALAAVLQFCLVIGLAVSGNLTPESALVAVLAGFATTGLLMAALLARHTGLRTLLPTPDLSILQPLVRTGAMLHPASVAIQLAPRLTLILVAAFLTPHAAGLYSLSLVLADSMLLASQALSMSAVHRQFSGEEPDAVHFTLDFIRQSLLLTIGVVIVVAPLAYPLVVGFYGSDFAGATLPFVILLLATAATAVEAPCRVLLVRIASPWLISGLVCASLALNALLTIVLIQFLSISGAALASVVAYWLLAVAMLLVVQRRSGHSISFIFGRPTRDDELFGLIRSLRSRVHLAMTGRSA